MTTATADALYWPWPVTAGTRNPLDIPILSGVTPFPIPGWTVDARITTRPGGDVIYTFPPELALLSDDGLTVHLIATAAASALWTFRRAWWSCDVTDPNSDPADPSVDQLIHGPLILTPS